MNKSRPDSQTEDKRLSNTSNISHLNQSKLKPDGGHGSKQATLDSKQATLDDWADTLPRTVDQRSLAMYQNSPFPGSPVAKAAYDNSRSQMGSARKEVLDVDGSEKNHQVPAEIHQHSPETHPAYPRCEDPKLYPYQVKLEFNPTTPPKSDAPNDSSAQLSGKPASRQPSALLGKRARPRTPGADRPHEWYVGFFDRAAEVLISQARKQ